MKLIAQTRKLSRKRGQIKVHMERHNWHSNSAPEKLIRFHRPTMAIQCLGTPTLTEFATITSNSISTSFSQSVQEIPPIISTSLSVSCLVNLLNISVCSTATFVTTIPGIFHSNFLLLTCSSSSRLCKHRSSSNNTRRTRHSHTTNTDSLRSL